MPDESHPRHPPHPVADENRLGHIELVDDPDGPHTDDLHLALTHGSRDLAWHNPSYVMLLAGQFVSLVGTHMGTLALPWFVLVTTGSKLRMTGVLLATTIPYAAFGLLAGALVDRFRTRPLMVWLDVARAAVTALVPLLALTGSLEYWHIIVSAAVSSTLATPYQGARMAIIPELVGEREEDLTLGNTALQLSMQMSTVFGPVLAGLLIGVVGNTNVLFFDAATYLAAAAIIQLGVRRWRPVPVVPSEHHWLRDVADGVRFIWHTRLIRIGIVVGMFITLGFAMMISAALPVFVNEVLGGDARRLGWLLSTWGLGATAGMVVYGGVAACWPWRRGPSVIVFLGLMALPLWVPPATRAFVPSLVAFGISGLFGAPIGIIVHTLLQTGTPVSLRGRVFSAFQALMLVASPLGLAVAGPALHLWGPVPLMFAVAALFTLTALGVAATREIRAL